MGSVFLEVVLPVALVAVLGGLVGRWRRIPLAPVSALTFYLFGPALVFHTLATTTLSAATSFRIVSVMLATFVAMYLAAAAWSRVVGHDPSWRAGFALVATSPNVGNMGLPVASLAFGAVGFEVAVMTFVVGAVLANSGGIAIASLAGGSRHAALGAPFRFPALYATVAGVLVNVLGIRLPVAIDAPIASLAAASVPVMLVVLGLQVQLATGREHLLDLFVANAGRLLIAPSVAWGVATAVGLGGVERATLTVIAAMPTAVIATIIATEFRAQPAFVTRAVVSSTLVSMVTLTVLITLVR